MNISQYKNNHYLKKGNGIGGGKTDLNINNKQNNNINNNKKKDKYDILL